MDRTSFKCLIEIKGGQKIAIKSGCILLIHALSAFIFSTCENYKNNTGIFTIIGINYNS